MLVWSRSQVSADKHTLPSDAHPYPWFQVTDKGKHAPREPTSVSEVQESHSASYSRQSAATKNRLHTSQSFLMPFLFPDMCVDVMGKESLERNPSISKKLELMCQCRVGGGGYSISNVKHVSHQLQGFIFSDVSFPMQKVSL